ncbi:hypothetical protein [Roseovarius phycicola]|uniref:Uncharacterized protein n=1 Tax=Roseovarius phycicola TaxID=3080976 RepID=A0ABZ2HIX6_9RHOB
MSYSSASSLDDDLFLDVPYRSADPINTVANIANGEQDRSSVSARYLIEERVRFPANPWKLQTFYYPKSSWEGIVTSVENGVVHARISPRDTANQNRLDEIDFNIDEVPDGDRNLVVENALFYLSVGKNRVSGGIPHSSVSIVFRRPPAWTERDIMRRHSIADEILQLMRSTD